MICPRCNTEIPIETTLCPICNNDPTLIEKCKLYIRAQQLEMENNKREAINIYAAIVDMNDSYAFNRINSIFAIHLLCIKNLGEERQLEERWLLKFCKNKINQYPEEAFKSIFILLDLDVITEHKKEFQIFLSSNKHPKAQFYWSKLQQKIRRI